jgi:carbon storage regulator CsrA
MVVMNRITGEAIVIGDSITVTVLEIDGEEVLLQIDSQGDEVCLTLGEHLAACDS